MLNHVFGMGSGNLGPIDPPVVVGLPERLVKVFGSIGIVGLVSFVSGVLTWVWRVMP